MKRDKFKHPFRVGKKQSRSVLDGLGHEVVVFPKGLENMAIEYCKFLNGENKDHIAVSEMKSANEKLKVMLRRSVDLICATAEYEVEVQRYTNFVSNAKQLLEPKRAMVYLKENVIAVELPEDARLIHVSNNKKPTILEGYPYVEYKDDAGFDWIKLNKRYEYSLIEVTPMSDDRWKNIVEPCGKFYPNYNPKDRNGVLFSPTATKSGLSLLESKGLDISKRYAIIKIEKAI